MLATDGSQFEKTTQNNGQKKRCKNQFEFATSILAPKNRPPNFTFVFINTASILHSSNQFSSGLTFTQSESMDKIIFIVERLNQPPFNKGISTMTELDGKTANELLELICEIVISIDGDLGILGDENAESKISCITGFLVVMKYIADEQVEIFQNLFLDGDKETMQGVMHWCLSRYEHLKKRAYLAKYLMPVEIPPEFMGEDLVHELSTRLKDMQTDFKVVHKNADKMKTNGMRPTEYKNEISQLEQERAQLSQKIQRLKKESSEGDEQYFGEMLKVKDSPLLSITEH